MKKLLALLMIASLAVVAFVAMLPAGATGDPKVIVCKYVSNENAPGGEVFGQVIDVSSNALDGFDPNLPFPQTFTDDQGTSVAVRYATGPGDHGDAVADCDQPPPPPTSTTVVPPPPPPPTTTAPPPPTTTTPPPPCKGTVGLGPWYGDPRINITLTGAGHFVVRGGIQRTTDTTVFDKTLACNEVFKIGRYKVEAGHFLNISLDGVRIVHVKPPRLN
jgi:hypothetical protein